MLEYLLKVSVVLAIGLLFYKVVLQQESFFGTNRFYMICCLILSFGLPLVTLPKLVEQQGVISRLFQEEEPAELQNAPLLVSSPTASTPSPGTERNTVEVSNQEKTASQESIAPTMGKEAEIGVAGQTKETSSPEPVGWMYWLALFYGFGVAVFTLNLLVQVIATVWKVISSQDKIEDNGFVIVNTAVHQAPCSFFKYIFIYPDDYDYETYEQIIAHEKIHVRQGHTYGLLVAELAVVILWFNPLAWLFKQEVEKNIEYQTDAILLEKEQVVPDRYQLSLLQIACPNKPLSITTNYNQSLLKQRIFMMNAKKSTPHAFWKYTFLAPLFFGTLLLLNEPAVSQAIQIEGMSKQVPAAPGVQDAPSVAAPETSVAQVPDAPLPKAAPVPQTPVEPVPGDETDTPEQETQGMGRKKASPNNTINTLGSATDMSQGFWYGHTTEKEYCIELKGKQNSSSWNINRCLGKNLFTQKSEEVFVLTKEAGTLQLNGKLKEEVSQGKYTFTEDPSYKEFLAKQNINLSGTNQNLLFFLFLGDVDKKYVSYLTANYSEISGRKLEELAIHAITLEEYKGFVNLFQKYNKQKPSMAEVIEANIHGISQEYVEQIQKMGFKDLPLRKIMEARIHRVTPEYADALKKAGFEGLTLNKIIEAKIHGITPQFIQDTKTLGFGDLSLNKIIELKIHGVSKAYVQELKAAGYGNLSLDKIIEAKIHGVHSQTIQELEKLGFKNLSIDKVISMRIHRVDANFLSGLEKEGFKNLSPDKAVEAKIHGVTADFIKTAKADGYNLKTLDEYINVKIMGYNRRARND
ncbi:MAG: M56 family metallopeptidase [Rufibacter sp.]